MEISSNMLPLSYFLFFQLHFRLSLPSTIPGYNPMEEILSSGYFDFRFEFYTKFQSGKLDLFYSCYTVISNSIFHTFGTAVKPGSDLEPCPTKFGSHMAFSKQFDLWLTLADPCMTFNSCHDLLHFSQGFFLPNLVVIGQARWPLDDLWPLIPTNLSGVPLMPSFSSILQHAQSKDPCSKQSSKHTETHSPTYKLFTLVVYLDVLVLIIPPWWREQTTK